jgi:hypothetical protein
METPAGLGFLLLSREVGIGFSEPFGFGHRPGRLMDFPGQGSRALIGATPNSSRQLTFQLLPGSYLSAAKGVLKLFRFVPGIKSPVQDVIVRECDVFVGRWRVPLTT